MRTILSILLILSALNTAVRAQLSVHSSSDAVVSCSQTTLDITGNWNNYGTYHSLSSTLRFSGVGDQYIFSYPGNIISDMTVKKASGSLFLTDTLLVSDSLRLVQGKILTSINAPLGLLSTARSTGGHYNSFIDGPLIRVLPVSATPDSFMFPTGDSLDFRPIFMKFQKIEIDTVLVTVEQFNGNANSLSSNYENLDKVSRVHYWKMASTGKGLWSSAQITMTYDTVALNDGVELAQELRVAQLDTISTTRWISLGGLGSANHSGVITTDPIADFGSGWFTFGDAGGGGDITLPVFMSLFELSTNRSDVLISWKTESEVNNNCWLIQRKDTNDFKTIATVNGRGTTPVATEYRYIDPQLKSGKAYTYRLVDVSHDGTMHFHGDQTIVVDLPRNYSLSQNYPNPFNEGTTILYDLPFRSDVDITLFNILGQKVAALVHTNREAGYHRVLWDGKNARGQAVASGVYIVMIRARNLTGQKPASFTKSKKMTLLK